MTEFVNDDVIDAVFGGTNQQRIEKNSTGWGAASPVFGHGAEFKSIPFDAIGYD
jgi:hypothetical protein